MGRGCLIRRILAAPAVALTILLGAAGAAAGATPIPEGPGASSLPTFFGAPAPVRPVSSPAPPRHPFMAPNGRSNLHEDAYQTDVHQGAGPLGRSMARSSNFLAGDCASITFDRRGRIVTVCVGLAGPRLYLLDPQTLDVLASFALPPRQPGTSNPFTDFAGGGYFYLDAQTARSSPPPTASSGWWARRRRPASRWSATYDLSTALGPTDKIISALPDWRGRLWFASVAGVVGAVDPATGVVRTRALGEGIGNSFAVDSDGSVFVVSNSALYRFEADATGAPVVSWREPYPNDGNQKSGQSQPGSGTTPTLMGSRYVSITDNADPIDVMVFKRARTVSGPRLVCSHPVFSKGASSTDQSLIGTPTAMVVENNHGYSGPAATENGQSTTGGLERVDLDAGGGCHRVWHSPERAPSVVPKLDAANGLVYTYTKEPRSDGEDAWYLTALSFRTGATVFKRLAGEGLGFNNNYAPITVGPDGRTIYVGVLGGLVALRDSA